MNDWLFQNAKSLFQDMLVGKLPGFVDRKLNDATILSIIPPHFQMGRRERPEYRVRSHLSPVP